MSVRGVVLFHTMSAALRAEKVLLQAKLQVKLVPTPRELSSDCGFSLRFEGCDAQQVQSLLLAAGVEYVAVHFPFPPVAAAKG